MRITFNAQYRDSAAAVERTSERLVDAQRQVSSGKRIGRISDDPTGAATAVAERNHLGQIDQYTRTADSVASRLAVVDTVLADIIDKLSAARAAAASARGTAKTTAERNAAAQQLGGLRDALVSNLNSTFHGTYLFGGAEITTRPYTIPPAGTVHVYGGDNNRVQVDIGDGRTVGVSLDGEAITRGSDPQDLFASIDDLIAAVNSGDDQGIADGMDAVQRAFDRATSAQARVGGEMQALDAQKLRLQQLHLSGVERVAKLEDVNMAEAITEMTHADAAYRAALGAVGTVSRVSLLDYLK